MIRKTKITIGTVPAAAVIAVAALVLLAPVDYDPVTMYKAAPIGTGYAAKMLCSGVFVSGREPEALWDEDLELMRRNMISGKVNYEEKSTEASIFGFLAKQKAVYRGDCGCTLLMDDAGPEFRNECDQALPKPPPGTADLAWPQGDAEPESGLTAEIDRAQLDRTLDWAFSEPRPKYPMRTRAVIVLYDGKIVAERYAPGITRDTRLLGWSMTKSVTSALVGILVRQGKLDIQNPAPVPEWQSPSDPRGKITLDQLLRMSSGLEFAEVYEHGPANDAGYMFFTVPDMAAYAAAKPLVDPPDTKFSYSSGTTMVLARIIRQAVGGAFTDYIAFPRRELFNKLGMTSALIEPDPSGTMVGAGFMYATARDWARFGLLYYNDGVWSGERILPEGWVEYTRTPSPTSNGYGAQWWLNADGPDGQWLPDCPADLYSTWGHEGQFVSIVPSRRAIVVRLGQTFDEEQNWDHNYFVSNVLKAMPQ